MDWKAKNVIRGSSIEVEFGSFATRFILVQRLICSAQYDSP